MSPSACKDMTHVIFILFKFCTAWDKQIKKKYNWSLTIPVIKNSIRAVVDE